MEEELDSIISDFVDEMIEDVDEVVEDIHPDPNKMNIRTLIWMLKFYVASLDTQIEESDHKEDSLDFISNFVSQLVYLCAKAPEIVVPIIGALIEDDWFRSQINKFEENDKYLIICKDEKGE